MYFPTLLYFGAAHEKFKFKRTPTQRDWQKLSTCWRAEINQRIAHLERLRDLMTGCVGCGCLSIKKCPIYNADDKLGIEAGGPVLLDNENASKIKTQ